jgi:diguanylate cyclase (GGDEF)-like protein
MKNDLESVRLEGFLKLVSACARLRDYDPLLSLLAQRTHRLLEFERFNILLCDDGRQIVKSFVIEDHSSQEVPPEEIQLSQMELIFQTLVTGAASSGAAGICTPMISAGRLIGVICLAVRFERYTIPELRLIQFLADCLAGTFDRLAQGRNGINSTKDALSVVRSHRASTVKSHAVSLHMSHLAQHDALTDLPNRLLLFERLDRALALSRRYKRRLAVLFLDLDRFKEVNDSLGHAIGDQVLRQMSDRMVRCVRSSDTVSRFGGDEFVILLSELDDAKDAAICAGKIIAAVTTPLKVGSHDIQLSISIGIGIYPDDGNDAETLIKSADTAMYHAKVEGHGHCHFFKQEMNVFEFRQRTSK